MRATEFLLESHINTEIDEILQSKGYKKLGHGQDQSAWLEPNSQVVLKIFGTKNGTGTSGDYTPAQKTFIAFANFCKQHPNNQFLPQILGWETFDFLGERYLQIRIERLFEFPNDSGWKYVLSDIADAISSSGGDKSKAARFFDDVVNSEWRDTAGPFEELISHIGEKGYYTLWNTIAALHKVAKAGNFVMDLHGGNFMLGSDGHIVISDPFFSGWDKQ